MRAAFTSPLSRVCNKQLHHPTETPMKVLWNVENLSPSPMSPGIFSAKWGSKLPCYNTDCCRHGPKWWERPMLLAQKLWKFATRRFI